MKQINEELQKLYKSHETGILNVNSSIDRDLDGPFLMDFREDLYNKAQKKILFIGQEPYGWLGGTSNTIDVDTLMKKYIDFEMANGIPNRNSPFWRGLFLLNGILNPDQKEDPCFLWTNVTKYCTVEGRPIPFEDIKFIINEMNLLPNEIKIINPDGVIFFSGPDYDEKIQIQFDGEIQFKQVQDDIPAREFARLIHKDLPKNTFRTYHPNALMRQHKWNYLELIGCYSLGIDICEKMSNFRSQIQELANEFELKVEMSDMIGQTNTGFYFFNPKWEHCVIGFEFESGWAGDFFYGIVRKDKTILVPPEIMNNIKKIENAEGSTEYWPYWRWFENRNWNIKTFEEIENGELKRKIKIKVEDILAKLDKFQIEL